MSDKKNTSDKDTSEILEKIDALSNVLKGDLTSIEPNAALETIDEWYKLLNKSKEPEIKEIATGLKEMQKLLKTEDAGHELGELICHLGEQITDVSADADKELKKGLQALGKQLNKIGQSLGKEEEQEPIEALSSLIELLEQEPQDIDSKIAIQGIDQWYEQLNKSDDKNLKAIATELKELKKQLSGGKGADLGQSLTKLGEHTTKVSADAGKGFKRVTQKLGKTLTKFAKSLDSK
jgi:type I site-specific restriction-modification system R (restriction) subunit